jgi:hypothetical protein
MFALERMAIAQHIMMRAARLDAGPFTSAMNDVLDRSNDPIIPMDVDMVGDGDIEITRAQNRNYCIAEGFRRIAKESNLMKSRAPLPGAGRALLSALSKGSSVWSVCVRNCRTNPICAPSRMLLTMLRL